MRAQLMAAVALATALAAVGPARAAAPDPRAAPTPPTVRVVEVFGAAHALVDSGPRDLRFVATTGATPGRDTPEATAEASVRAMARGDFEAWLALWEPAARQGHEARLTEPGHARADWVDAWRRSIGDGEQRFVRRYDVDGFVVILYRPDRLPDTAPLALPIVLRRQPDGAWLLSQGLARTGLVKALAGLGGAVAPR